MTELYWIFFCFHTTFFGPENNRGGKMRLILVLMMAFTLFFSLELTAEENTYKIGSDSFVSHISGYKSYPKSVQDLIIQAKDLTSLDLPYRFGSANPANGGLDCSGAIQYLLNNKLQLHDVPRQASDLYQWVWQKGKYYSVYSNNFHSFEFSKLKPGDLLFWTETYSIHRNPPITHVMLYLGKNQHGDRLMFGSTNGRTYQGKTKKGVSVFSFKLSKTIGKGKFIGYGCIPGLTCEESSIA